MWASITYVDWLLHPLGRQLKGHFEISAAKAARPDRIWKGYMPS